jgi:hypothetical protein
MDGTLAGRWVSPGELDDVTSTRWCVSLEKVMDRKRIGKGLAVMTSPSF